MNPRVKRIVMAIQDLQTKDKKDVAIVSCDIHLNTKDKKKVISFQMLLASNKEFARNIKDLVAQALMLHDKK